MLKLLSSIQLKSDSFHELLLFISCLLLIGSITSNLTLSAGNITDSNPSLIELISPQIITISAISSESRISNTAFKDPLVDSQQLMNILSSSFLAKTSAVV